MCEIFSVIQDTCEPLAAHNRTYPSRLSTRSGNVCWNDTDCVTVLVMAPTSACVRRSLVCAFGCVKFSLQSPRPIQTYLSVYRACCRFSFSTAEIRAWLLCVGVFHCMPCAILRFNTCVCVGKLSFELLLRHRAEPLSEIFNTLLRWYAPFLRLFVQVWFDLVFVLNAKRESNGKCFFTC